MARETRRQRRAAGVEGEHAEEGAGEGAVLAAAALVRNHAGVEHRSDRLDAVQRAHIEAILDQCGWRVNGAGNAAERLGIHPNTLRFRMKKLGIVRREPLRDSRRLRSDHGSQAGDRAS